MMVWIIALAVPVLGAAIHLIGRAEPASTEAIGTIGLLWFAAAFYGVVTFVAGLQHPITPDRVAKYIGWPTGSGFQRELGWATVGIGAAGMEDPNLAMAWWGEAFVLGPNINAPMMPEAVAPALAALAKAVELARGAPAKDRAMIAALEKRYSADPKAERAALDAAFADAMKSVAAKYSSDDTILVLYAESIMDTQPWDYWEEGGAKPKGRAAEMLAVLEQVYARNPKHPGALHLYIHAVEASTKPERALPHARRLAALMPGAGHIVHMPAHIYYRTGLYKESLEVNKRAMAVDEQYFKTSPSDPMYKSAYYPHNIHFVLVSAQMGGDGPTALDAAAKLDASLPDAVIAQFAMLEPLKAAPYLAHASFSAPEAILALKVPPKEQVVVSALAHYARALAFAAKKDVAGARREIDAIAAIEQKADFKPATSPAAIGHAQETARRKPQPWKRRPVSTSIFSRPLLTVVAIWLATPWR